MLDPAFVGPRSEEHTSELQSPLNISYAVFCFKKKIPELITKTLERGGLGVFIILLLALIHRKIVKAFGLPFSNVLPLSASHRALPLGSPEKCSTEQCSLAH